jgi:hypothetical protein
MELTIDILREFKGITNVDVESFFLKCVNFFNGGYNRIVSFYKGDLKGIDKGPFEEFDKLERECEDILATFQQMSERLANLKWYMVLEQLEEVQLRLLTLKSINRWSRSSLTKFGYDQAIQATYILKPHETLEGVAQDILGLSTPQDDWYNIAMSNDLTEEEYTPQGGVPLQLRFPRVNRGVQVQSVVDTMIGKTIYGKDLYRKVQFEDEDLKVLGYDDTIQQAVEILAGLKKGDNPSYPSDGLQKEVTIGGNRAALNFPVIQRQWSETFGTDDTLKNFSISNLSIEEDQLTLDFSVETRLGESKEGEVVV